MSSRTLKVHLFKLDGHMLNKHSTKPSKHLLLQFPGAYSPSAFFTTKPWRCALRALWIPHHGPRPFTNL